MDANKDEANKCCKLAKAAMLRKDYGKAIKFLRKANSMYPSDEYRALITQCEKATPAAEPKPMNEHNQHQRETPNINGATSSSATPEQESVCKQVIKAKDYYDMLNVSHSATTDDIKRAYKKLALKLHPDKNPHPQASEAFKKLSQAFQCLSNTDSRRQYDISGCDSQQGQSMHAGHGGGMTPEEIFAAFFGYDPFGQSRGNNFRVNRTFVFNHPRQPQPQPSSPSFLRLIPFFFVLACIWLLHFGHEPVAVFDYERSYKYNQKVTTNLNGVVYYVDKSSFDRDFPVNSVRRFQLEYEVDFRYFDKLCSKQKMELQRKLYSHVASFSFPPKELYETPKSCTILGSLKERYSKAIMQSNQIKG
ncbi:bifunctional DnaJ domain/Chaperone J-domain superfamily/DnaJ domain [Babesia duncani]|uniref:Bifunctional DnaJ domain/Chaperone J-domain superfamily/DnaJ domain n=1 Tax=Babesia duncani TaxID=323732 RepID=A0AAD9PNB4_9APIC|nr:bifunctional DnaJ domain/Chaperone J-domain superfamily/DnaJ domain [Babesia duncani]